MHWSAVVDDLSPSQRCEDYLLRAKLLESRGRDPSNSLLRAVAVDPNSSRARFELGTFLHRRGNPRAAVLELKRAISLDRNYADPRIAYATILQNSDDLRGAQDQFVEACNVEIVQTKRANALVALGRFFEAARRDLDSAELCYRRATSADPQNKYAKHALNRLCTRSAHRTLDGHLVSRPTLPLWDYPGDDDGLVL